MRILIAGDGGYIGAVLSPFFRTAGHEIDGLDLGLYEGCDLGSPLADTLGRRPADMRASKAEFGEIPAIRNW